jgi:hypothetical protein
MEKRQCIDGGKIMCLNHRTIFALEAEIDQLVYKLYNLTPAEIAIVEGQ